MSLNCSAIRYKFAWPPFCTAHSLSHKTQAHLPFTVCVWPQRYKHGEWSDTVHMQLHYEYFKSDSIRVTLMSNSKIIFILHFVSLHSKVSELVLFNFLLKLGVLRSQYSKLLQLNFSICFHSKVNLLIVVIKTWPQFSLMGENSAIRFLGISMSDYIQWQWYIIVYIFNGFLIFEAEIIWSFPEIQHLKLRFWCPLMICHRFNVYNSELVDN